MSDETKSGGQAEESAKNDNQEDLKAGEKPKADPKPKANKRAKADSKTEESNRQAPDPTPPKEAKAPATPPKTAAVDGPDALPQWQVIARKDCCGVKAGEVIGFIACESPNGLVDAVRTDHAKVKPVER